MSETSFTNTMPKTCSLTQAEKNAIRRYQPYHLVDSGDRNGPGFYFKVFADQPGEVAEYGPYRLVWTLQRVEKQRWDDGLVRKAYISINQGPFFEYTIITSDWGLRRANKAEIEIVDYLKEVKEEKHKEYRRARAREKRQKLKAEAEELGITVKELKERRKAAKPAATKKDIERTQRIMEIAPTLRDLKTEVDRLLNQLETDPSQTHFTYISRGKSKIEDAISFLTSWNKPKQ